MSKIIDLHSKDAQREDLPEVLEILGEGGWFDFEKDDRRITTSTEEVLDTIQKAKVVYRIDEETLAFTAPHAGEFLFRIVKIKK